MTKCTTAVRGFAIVGAAAFFTLAATTGCFRKSASTVKVAAGPLKVDAPYLETLTSDQQFTAMGAAGTGFLRGGRSVKFLADLRDTSSPRLYFLNGNYPEPGKAPESLRFHFFFATQQLGIRISNADFEKSTYFGTTKSFVAGTLQTYVIDEGKPPLYGIQLFPGDWAKEGTIVTIAEIVRKHVAFPSDLAFVATGPQQTIGTAQNALDATGVKYTTIEALMGKVNFIPMNSGSTFGILRLAPKSDLLTPLDIPVFQELPLDLAVVAGTITRAFQDTNSHINLKSKERNTPNMMLRDAGPDHPALRGLDGKPVKFSVRDDGFSIEPATMDQVNEQTKEKANRPWVAMKAVLDTATEKRSILNYTSMCAKAAGDCLALSPAYGSKASNLGFLAHPSVLGRKETPKTVSAKAGYDLTPHGFGVPLQFYVDFVNYAPNATLRTKIAAFIDNEKKGALDPAARLVAVKEVQEAFYAATFPPERLKTLQDAWTTELAGMAKIKIRSSANAEDISGFNGAGLYDSFSAKSDSVDKPDGGCRFEADDENEGGDVKGKMKPRTIQCAVKGVFASLWNKRAVEERNNARIDHASAYMGLAVVPVYDNEAPVAANSVVVTRVINSDDLYGYTISSQQGENTVTNPIPGTISETIIANFVGDRLPSIYTTMRFAKPEVNKPALTQPLLGKHLETMFALARTVETAYCLAKPDYLPGSGSNKCADVTSDKTKPRALDMEFKVLGSLSAAPGAADAPHFLCKQVREFTGK